MRAAIGKGRSFLELNDCVVLCCVAEVNDWGFSSNTINHDDCCAACNAACVRAAGGRLCPAHPQGPLPHHGPFAAACSLWA